MQKTSKVINSLGEPFLLQGYLDDEEVSMIDVRGPSDVWYEKKGRLLKIPEVLFPSPASLEECFRKVIAQRGVTTHGSVHWLDGHGLVIEELPTGWLVSKAMRAMPSLVDLLNYRFYDEHTKDVIEDLVSSSTSLLVCGNPGSGRINLLRALLGPFLKDPESPLLHVAMFPLPKDLRSGNYRFLPQHASDSDEQRLHLVEELQNHPTAILVIEDLGDSEASLILRRLRQTGMRLFASLEKSAVSGPTEVAFDATLYLERGTDGARRLTRIIKKKVQE